MADAAKKPDSPAAKKPDGAAVKKRDSPAAKKRGSQAAKKPDGAAVKKRDGPATKKRKRPDGTARKKRKKPNDSAVKKPDGPPTKKRKKPHSPRNFKIPGGVWRYSRSAMYSRRRTMKVNKTKTPKVKPKQKPTTVVKPIGGEKNGGTRVVKLKKAKKFYPTEDKPKLKKTRKMKGFKDHKRYLRRRITPGTILILLAGRHRGKRVVFLKQLGTGLLLVTGPYKINGCPLRRINQIYCLATSTKLDISKVKIPAHLNDLYFRRKKPQKKTKKDEEEIFDTKKEEYTVTEQRKKDQIDVDKQIMGSVCKHPDKKIMFGYLRALFYLQNKMYPHKMKF